MIPPCCTIVFFEVGGVGQFFPGSEVEGSCVPPGCGAGSGFDPAELPFVGTGSQVVVTAGATLSVALVFFPVPTLGFLAGVWEGGFREGGLVDSGAV